MSYTQGFDGVRDFSKIQVKGLQLHGEVNLKDYGIVSDGVTDQTAAIVALFVGQLASYRGRVIADYNTKFTPITVYNAIPLRVTLDDRSEINYGQPPVYTNKFRILVTNDVEADDSSEVVASTHHPSIILNNLGTAATASAAKRLASILFAAGINARGDNAILSLVQSFIQDGTNKWQWGILREQKWQFVNKPHWQPNTAYLVGDFVQAPGGIYECVGSVDAGLSGAVAPTGTGDTIADNQLIWDYFGGLSAPASLFLVDEEGRVSHGGADSGASDGIVLKVYKAAVDAECRVLFGDNQNNGAVKTDYEIRTGGVPKTFRSHFYFLGGIPTLDFREEDYGAILRLTKQQIYANAPSTHDFKAKSGATPSVADASAIVLTQAGATTVTNFLTTSAINQELVVWFGDGNSTIQHGVNIVLKSGANETPVAGTIKRFFRVWSQSAAWREA